MKSEKIILGMMILLAAGLLAGCCCHKDEPVQRHEIAMKTGVTGMLRRANMINNATDLQSQDLKIVAYYNGTTATCIDGAKLHYDALHDPDPAWVFWDGSAQMHYYWPIEGSVHTGVVPNITVSSLDFVGYCPYDLTHTGVTPSYTSGTPAFTCTLPMVNTGEGTTQDNLQEFLWAYTGNQTKETNSGTVDMSFKHPFARVQFLLAASHPDIEINRITLKGLKSGGTCSFDGTTSTWSDLTPAGTVNLAMSLTGDDAKFYTNPAYVQQIGIDQIVVPQTFGGEIEVQAGWTDWGETLNHILNATISSETWQPGYSYTYTFTITEHDMLVDVDKYTEQW